MTNRTYCTVAEVWDDLYPGTQPTIDEDHVFRYVQSASEFIDRRIGWFVPVTQARNLDGNGEKVLILDKPLLAATAVVDNDVTLTTADYFLSPYGRMWDYGPYTSIVVDDDSTLLSVWYNERQAVTITGRWGLYEATTPTGDSVRNTTSISATETALTTSSNVLLSMGMVLLIESEQCQVTGHPTTNTFTIVRGINGTTAAIHLNGVAISRYYAPSDVNYLCRELAGLAMKKAETGFTGQSGNADTGESFYLQEYPKASIAQVARNYRIVQL